MMRRIVDFRMNGLLVSFPLFSKRSPRRIIRITPILVYGAAVMAGIGLGLVVRRWRFPMRESLITVPATVPPPPPPPEDLSSDRPMQPISAGKGDLFYRRYQVDIVEATLTPESLMALVYQDINQFVARELAVFEKTKGAPDQWKVGDEWYVHITGPWDGPVRLIHVEPTMFAFITLEGHLEAGEIHFRACESPEAEGGLRFEIMSWARSRDTITDLFYRILGVSKAAQTALWTYFCGRAAELSGGKVVDEIHVTTQKVPETKESVPLWKQYSRDFERWSSTALNFDPTQRETFTEQNGWRLDDYRIGLPSEPPGEPLANGSWNAAREVVMNYEFPDPSLISGIFIPDRPLSERIMILKARFLVFTFYFGVRICSVIDETRTDEKRGGARVWGYSYQTLEGHFERGEITFEVWKFLDTGEVEFRVHAYSQIATIHNPFYRLGFLLFGRSLQRRFARTSMERMQQLVIARMAKAEGTLTPEVEPTDKPEVQPISTSAAATEKKEAIEEKEEKQAGE